MSRRSRRMRNTSQGQTGSSGAVRNTSSGLTRFARERPLVVVGVGVAVGMALGALLPWSRIEDDLFGEQAENLKDTARELANDGYEKVKSAAQSAYIAATETLRGSESTNGEGGTKGPATADKTVGTAPYHQ